MAPLLWLPVFTILEMGKVDIWFGKSAQQEQCKQKKTRENNAAREMNVNVNVAYPVICCVWVAP